MRLNPVLAEMRTYPFVRLTEARDAATALGVDVIDFGIGEPREPVPPLVQRALLEAVQAEAISPYPTAVGLPEAREAVAGWVHRRFGASLDPSSQVVPTLGTKEAIFNLAQIVVRRGERVAVTTPGYPVAARGAAFAGAEVLELVLDPARGWHPDLDGVDWDDVALLWLNYPNNPSAAVATMELYERASALAREHDFVLGSDEAYSELWFAGDPPVSALQLDDLTNVLVFNTLSKRSSVPGYRAGFAAGDPELVAALNRFRPNVGVAPQAFVQRAAVVAWGDDAHVAEVRERYRAKRDALLPALEAVGLRLAGGDASFFLWLAIPQDAGADDEAYALSLLERHGVIVAPGSFFGAGGQGHVRVALMPTLEECRRAAQLIGSAA